MKVILPEEMDRWERIYRTNFINSLSGFKSVSLIGTIDEQERTNLAVISSVVHIGSNPPLIGFISRPEEARQHTLANIRARGEYTINQIDASFVSLAHQSSARYPTGVSEFEAVGLLPEYLGGHQAPFVKESKVKFALCLREIIPITLNKTSLVIGQVNAAYVPEGILEEDGFLRLEDAGTLCSNGLDAYYRVNAKARFSYAKPDHPIQQEKMK